MNNVLNPTTYLLRLGFFPQHYGFGYLVQAISAVAANPKGYYSRSVDIFEILKRDFGVQRPKASRCMHYSIATAWQAPNNEELRRLFPTCQANYPPAVTEFVCRIAIGLSEYNQGGFADASSDISDARMPALN